MLLLLIRLPVFGLSAVPKPMIALVGRLVPAGLRLQNETVLLLLPSPEVVLNRIFPPAVPGADVDEPRIVHLVSLLPCGPLLQRMVLVLAVGDAVVLARA